MATTDCWPQMAIGAASGPVETRLHQLRWHRRV